MSQPITDHLINWLLEGDVAIQYQVYRDLLHEERPDLRARVAVEGWGALDVLLQKRRKDSSWPLQAKHAGQVHFDMERPGQPSRWNTLRALRVMRHFGDGQYSSFLSMWP